MKSQIKKKRNGGILELLIPTFFKKIPSHERAKFFGGQKNYGEVVLNWRTNDRIMSWFGKTFINDKNIFQ